MAIKHIGHGEDFEFSKDFGFSGSSAGGKEARNHPDNNEGHMKAKISTEARGSGHPRGYANGGAMMPQQPMPGRAAAPRHDPVITLPASQAAKAAQALVAVGRQQGANSAVSNLASAAHARRGNPAAAMMPAQGALSSAGQAPPVPMQGRVPMAAPAPGDGMGMAKGGFIAKALKHPGRETRRAESSGRSVHAQMEHDKSSKDPSLRGAANMGLRLTGGDLRPKKGRH